MRRLGLIGAVAVVGLSATTVFVRDASACGGTFTPPSEDDSPVTAHRMILSLSPQQTTLFDEIEFSGAASSFAWVLPIKGAATVGLSSDLLFSSLDQLTETQVVTPPTLCPPPPSCEDFGDPSAAAVADAGAARGVVVTEQQQVGPYETVQLQSSDPTALTSWLTSHGYAISPAATTVVASYVSAKFNFLAMKLAPGKGVTAMRPVRVTTSGASPVLPLRMISVGTGASTSVTLWVVADGRWQPQNFPFFEVTDSDIAWNWNTGVSTFESVRASKEKALGGRGWEVESSIELNQNSLSTLVFSDGSPFGEPVSAAGAYLPVGDAGPGDDGGLEDAGAPLDGGPETADQAREADLSTLFAGISGANARITRLRSDIAHTALTADLELEASADQSELSNVRTPLSQIGEPQCAVYNSSCEETGQVPRSEATASATGGGGCSTTSNRSPFPSRAALGVFLGCFGLAAVRARRQRKAPR